MVGAMAEPLKIVVPGLGGSGPAHWQSLWSDGRAGWLRVEQDAWDEPDPAAWVAALEETLQAGSAPAVLVAHSLGCELVARWARSGSAHRVAGAMLVAPADVDRAGALPALRAFAPGIAGRLPFPSWLVASTDDPFCSFGRAVALADRWGARLRSVGASGHVNVASGHGRWPEGERLLGEVLAHVAQGRPAGPSTSAA
jgi:predicted alpha/beta hydrolase family esterase